MPKRTNNNYHRVDVKLPIAVYDQVSEIAVNNFDAKVHHISNKPEITSTLLHLLELGIESFNSGNKLTDTNTDKVTDTQVITDQVKDLIREMIDNAIFCHKLDCHTDTNTDKVTDTQIIIESQVRELIKDELITISSKVDDLSAIVTNLKGTKTSNNKNKALVSNPRREDFEQLQRKLTDIPTGRVFSNLDEIAECLGVTQKQNIWKDNKKEILAYFPDSKKGNYKKL